MTKDKGKIKFAKRITAIVHLLQNRFPLEVGCAVGPLLDARKKRWFSGKQAFRLREIKDKLVEKGVI